MPRWRSLFWTSGARFVGEVALTMDHCARAHMHAGAGGLWRAHVSLHWSITTDLAQRSALEIRRQVSDHLTSDIVLMSFLGMGKTEVNL